MTGTRTCTYCRATIRLREMRPSKNGGWKCRSASQCWRRLLAYTARLEEIVAQTGGNARETVEEGRAA